MTTFEIVILVWLSLLTLGVLYVAKQVWGIVTLIHLVTGMLLPLAKDENREQVSS